MSYSTLVPADFARLLSVTPGLTLIDVRSPAEFAEVHATSAQNLPLVDLSPAALSALGHGDVSAPVYLLCQSGKRACAAADKLSAAGYKQPVVIAGGTEAWLAAGLPVARGEGGGISLERQVRIVAGSLVLAGVLLSRFANPGFIWLSGFVGAGLAFAGLTDFCGMGLLLAKAPWNRR
ncbi:MAG: hypothetical protein RIQ79_1769 [Verrucomicrobiota bacterium]